MIKIIKFSMAFVLLAISVKTNAQVVLDANSNSLTYNNTTEGITIKNVFLKIKGSGGVVSENGKKTVCPNETKGHICAELSLWDAIRYKFREWFSPNESSDDGELDDFTIPSELTVFSKEDGEKSFVFRKGSSFIEISNGVFETSLTNLTITNN